MTAWCLSALTHCSVTPSPEYRWCCRNPCSNAQLFGATSTSLRSTAHVSSVNMPEDSGSPALGKCTVCKAEA